MIHSPFGQVLKAIRENEPRAISLGYDTTRYKLMAFVLSATLAGLAGATKALVFQLASLTDVHWTMSGEVVLMTLLGGLGTIFGPVVGALVIITMENYLAQLGAWVTIVQGAIFVVCVLTFRRGARHIARSLVADEFDISVFQDLPLDHGLHSPLTMMWPKSPDWPGAVIPLVVNVVQQPLPKPKRCFALGKAVRRAIDSYPET